MHEHICLKFCSKKDTHQSKMLDVSDVFLTRFRFLKFLRYPTLPPGFPTKYWSFGDIRLEFRFCKVGLKNKTIISTAAVVVTEVLVTAIELLR